MSKHRVNFEVERDQWKRFKEVASRRFRSRSEQLRYLIDKAIRDDEIDTLVERQEAE